MHADLHPNLSRSNEAYPQIENKGLVLQFLDPGDTGLGKPLGFLFRGEVRAALEEQDAGIIVSYRPGGERIVNIPEESYHLGALKNALDEKCYMTFWGVVWNQGEQIFLNTYLSILPQVRNSDLLIQFRAANGLDTEISRTMFNFPLIQAKREELFERVVYTKIRDRILGPNPMIKPPLSEESLDLPN